MALDFGADKHHLQVVEVVKPANAGKVRAFRHIRTGKYLAESGDSVTHWGSGTRNHLIIR